MAISGYGLLKPGQNRKRVARISHTHHTHTSHISDLLCDYCKPNANICDIDKQINIIYIYIILYIFVYLDILNMFVHVSMSSFGRTTPTVALPRLCQTWSCSACALLSPSECAPGCRIVSFKITRDSRDFYDSVCTVLFSKCNWL